MVEPVTSLSAVGAPDLEVAGIRWERIQLVVTIRDALGGAAPASDERRFFLSGIDRPGMRLEGRPCQGPGEVRFNIFTAADRMPLPAGRWRLMAAYAGAGTPARVACEQAVVAEAGVDREFVHPLWTFRVSPTAADGGLEVRVAVRRTEGAVARQTTVWSIWYRLQRAVRIGAFRTSVALVRLLPRRERLIVFTSDSREQLGGNLKIVHDRMVERGLDRGNQLRSILRPSVRSRRSMVDRMRLAWLLARADVILLDDYQPAIYQLEPHHGVRIIQLWHAWGAFKTVGYSRIGKPGGPSPFSSVHKNYTYATASSEHEVPFYAEAFGLPDSSVVPTGTPRMDEFLDPSNQEAGRERALAAFPAARGRRVVLFAPTFRGDTANHATYPADVIDMTALHVVAEKLDAVVILKMHPFVGEPLEIASGLADRLLDAGGTPVDVNDLLLVADVLVTDYSSLIFECAALGRPMLFFAFDLEEYVASRDFYEPFASFAPGKIVRNFPELIEALRSDDFEQHKVEPFARAHVPAEAGSATDRIIDQLILAP